MALSSLSRLIIIIDYENSIDIRLVASLVAGIHTHLYNFDHLKPHFYIVKLGFTGLYIIFLISA